MSSSSVEGRLFSIEGMRTVPSAIAVPDAEKMRERVVAMYEQAKHYEIEQGSKWYPDAHAFCRGLQQQYAETTKHLSIAHFAGIVAALSPKQSWKRNITLAHTLLIREGRAEGIGLGYVARDAAAIYAGQSPEDVLFEPSRTNHKVRNFYRNILDPDDPHPVTVDRHISGIVSGNVLAYAQKKYLPDDDYQRIADSYRDTAKELAILPSVLQATTWLVSRRLQGLRDQPEVSTPSLF